MEITVINGFAGMIKLTMLPNAHIKPQNIPVFLNSFRPDLRFIATNLQFEYSYHPSGLIDKDEQILLDTTEDLLSRMSEVLR
ncbi:MAG: hypothetical protein PHX95_09990 [Lachnospiraceae bacterium]|jgi:hypothetical protein|nr:hypothetical protein [Lachnospiraceae bacterium]